MVMAAGMRMGMGMGKGMGKGMRMGKGMGMGMGGRFVRCLSSRVEKRIEQRRAAISDFMEHKVPCFSEMVGQPLERKPAKILQLNIGLHCMTHTHVYTIMYTYHTYTHN